MTDNKLEAPSMGDMEAAIRERAVRWDPRMRDVASKPPAGGGTPIEYALGLSIQLLFNEFIPGMVFPMGREQKVDDVVDLITRSDSEPFVIAVFAQVRIGRYCVDFLVATKDREGRAHFIAVECDGHEHHERTKQQAEHDRRRDRELQAMGYPVMRFAGSEIWRSPTMAAFNCLNQVALSVIHRGAAA